MLVLLLVVAVIVAAAVARVLVAVRMLLLLVAVLVRVLLFLRRLRNGATEARDELAEEAEIRREQELRILLEA